MGALYVRVGGAWVPIAGGGPRGLIGRALINTAQNGIGTTVTDITGLAVNFTAVAGRVYKATMSLLVLPSTTGSAILTLTDAAGALLQRFDIVPGTSGAHAGVCVVATFAPTAGAFTVKGRAQSGAGTINVNGVNGPSQLVVEDIGGT